MSSNLLDIRRPSPHVAEVWLNRPELRNAFNSEVIAELARCFGALSADSELRTVVLAAHGKAFCAGADLNWMRAMADYSWAENQADAMALADMLWALRSCPVPVIGRVQGDAFAGGVGLVALCDIVVAADTAHFCLSEAKLGLLPATIGPYVVQAIGERAAQRYFTTAERFNAEEAKRLGLVHEVCAPEALDAQVQALLTALLANGPVSVRANKRLVRDLAAQPLVGPQAAALRAETARLIADIRCSPEGREGVQAFLDKREPAWRAAPSSPT